VTDGAGGVFKVHFDDREVARAALAERRTAATRESGDSALVGPPLSAAKIGRP